MIRIHELCYRRAESSVIDAFSLHIPTHQVVSLLGPNGCGKSTLLALINRQIIPLSGHIEMPEDHRVGMVFQDYRQHLLPYHTVRDNIEFPLVIRGIAKRERVQRVEDIVEKLCITFDLLGYPYQLSGGQAQLVSLARALIVEPTILIMDEAFSALDCSTSIALQARVLKVIEELRLTTIVVSHNIEEAILLADRVVVLSKRPLSIREDLSIDLPRPRSHAMIGNPEFARLYQRVLGAIDQGDS